MDPSHRARYLPLALAALLAVPLVTLSGRAASAMGVDQPYEVRYVPDGRALAFLPAAIRLSIANAYWLATVQYIGDQHLGHGPFAGLFPLVDLVTELDPDHGYAYQTGGIVLSSAGRLDESDRILKKGMERGPNWWSYPFYLAYNDYFYRGDYDSAARWAAIAARTPGASPNISHLALALEVKRGDPEAGLALVQELLRHPADEQVRERLEEQEKLARLQVEFARLDAAVARFRERSGRAPSRLEELVAAGLVDGVPPDPFGGRFELRDDGKVHATGRDFRFKPREPGRLATPTANPAATSPPAEVGPRPAREPTR